MSSEDESGFDEGSALSVTKKRISAKALPQSGSEDATRDEGLRYTCKATKVAENQNGTVLVPYEKSKQEQEEEGNLAAYGAAYEADRPTHIFVPSVLSYRLHSIFTSGNLLSY